MRSLRLTAIGVLASSLAISSCGGSGGGGTTTVTTPTATVTVAQVAPSLGTEIARVIDAAMRAGTASVPGRDQATGPIAWLMRWLGPVTLHAQTSNFVANCSRGGNVNIRYFGGRTAVLSGIPVVFTNCGLSSNNRDVLFSGTLNSNGYWTATEPGPVTLSGDLTVNEIGTATVNGSVNGQQFGGTVGGTIVGTPDATPPPNPNSCPGQLSRTTIDNVPVPGTVYLVTLTVAANCPWTITATPAFVNATPIAGRGFVLLQLIVANNTGVVRSGVVTVNGQNITINQLGTGTTTLPPAPPPVTPPVTPPTGTGQDAILGTWTGTVTASSPCSVGMPNSTFNWRATFTRKGSAYNMAFRDDYFDEPIDVDVPVLDPNRRAFAMTASDGVDTITLDGVFAADWLSLTGPVSGTIDCVTSKRPTTGTWQGRRTGS